MVQRHQAIAWSNAQRSLLERQWNFNQITKLSFQRNAFENVTNILFMSQCTKIMYIFKFNLFCDQWKSCDVSRLELLFDTTCGIWQTASPAGTRRINNAIITRRRFDVIITLLLRHVSTGLLHKGHFGIPAISPVHGLFNVSSVVIGHLF